MELVRAEPGYPADPLRPGSNGHLSLLAHAGIDPTHGTRFQPEAKYIDLVERLPMVIYIDALDDVSSSVYVSPQTTAIFGYTPEDWAADPNLFATILHRDDRDRVLAEHARTHATGEPLRTEYRLISRDGRVVWVRDEGALVRDSSGEAVCLQGFMIDITESKERELALRESEAIVGSSLDAIVSHTREGIVTSWNAAAERLYGYSADEMIGNSVAILSPAERLEEFSAVNEKLRSGETIETVESVRVRKDGTQIEVESTLSPILDASGEVAGISVISRDISERKRSKAVALGQSALLELIATGAPLTVLLDRLASLVEEQSSGVLASILLLDRDGLHLRHGAAPSLPEAYTQAVDGVAIGPQVGSCGTAAHRRERVIVSDIETDPLWSDYRDLAASFGLRACWSTPIFATDDTLLGTFALYYRRPQSPAEQELEFVDSVVHIASIAIERSRAEETLRTSEGRYRDLFENANEPIAMIALDETITEVNAAFARLLGYSRTELVGSNLSEYLSAEEYENARRATELKLANEVEGTVFEQEFIAKGGQTVILEVSSRIIEEDGRPVGIQGLCRDITARKRAERELRQLDELNRHQALHDGLTGLPNRACFRERIEAAIGACDRDGSEMALLMIDLDRFKEINDSLGHHYGDLLLAELARRFSAGLRHTDTIARLGGDEFGMLVPQLSGSAGDLEPALDRIFAALDQPFHINELPLHVEASIGIARYPAHGTDVDLLLQRADVAMYVAKENGVSHALYDPELDRHDAASLTLLSELPRAIHERELVLHYQPKADVRTRRLTSVEALVRWQHPTRGLIPPAEFIPLAERTGLIQPLTMFVLDEALAQCKRWQQQGHVLTVALNLSMRNLHELTLPGKITELLRKWDLPGDRLTLEITESAIAADPERTKTIVEQLSALGITISIDDFGIGYTSLAQLARLAVDQLKIDRSLILSMGTDASDASIVRSIITLGHDLGLEVVAEGVETKTAWDELAKLGCDKIQGFYISQPLAADDLSRFLATTPKQHGAPRAAS